MGRWSTVLVSDLIARTKQDLYGSYRGQYNQLANSISTTDTSLVTSYDLMGITPGTIIGIDDELIYAWAIASDTKTVTLQRGWLGSTAVAHSANAIIEVSPRFGTVQVRNALIDEINSWPNGLFSQASVDLNVAAYQRAIDLAGVPSNFVRILECLRSPQPTLDSWTRVKYRIQRNLDDPAFPSGSAIFLNRIVWNQVTWPQFSSAYTLRLNYAIPFNTTVFTDATDLYATVGLNVDLIDIPRIGATWRLLEPKEIQRTSMSAQGEARDARDVPSGSIQRAAAGYEAQRNERIRQEVERLLIRYGWRQAV